MRKLLSAGFMRLWKSRVFWLVLLGAVAIPAIMVYAEYQSFQRLPTLLALPEEAMFNVIPIMVFICPVLISMFLGTEYSDGTIRNKLVCGHRRMDIYLSGLVVCSAASVVMLLVVYAVSFFLTLTFSTEIQMPAWQILYIIFCSVMVTAAFSAICVLVVMNIQKKATGVVVSLVLMILMTFGSSYIDSQLREPETNYGAMVMHENGQVEFLGEEPNPLYISGTQRVVLELALDAIPVGQAMQINNQDFSGFEYWPLLSLGITAVTSAAGVLIFKKKDIK